VQELCKVRRKSVAGQYELPSEMPPAIDDDPRLATKEEIYKFVDEFRPTNLYNIDSDTFEALPPEIQI
jgi:hypothetical protein